MKKKLKINKKILLKTFIAIILIAVLSMGDFLGVRPFGVACLYALVWSGFNPFVCSISYLGINVLYSPSLECLYSGINAIGILLLVLYIHKKLKLHLNIFAILFYSLLGQVVAIYYMATENYYIYQIVSFLLLILISIAIFSLVFQLIILRGVFYKTTLNESLAVFYLIVTLGLSISKIQYFNIDFIKLILAFAIIFLISINKGNWTIYLSAALGLGALLYDLNYLMFANILIIGLSSLIYKFPHRFKSSLCLIISDVCFSLYANFSLMKMLFAMTPIAIGIILALLIPTKAYAKLQDKFYVTDSEMSMRNIVNITRNSLHKRLNTLSNVFNEMKFIHLNLIKEELGHEQVVTMLSNEVMNSLCKDCRDKNKCYRTLLEDASTMNKIVDLAVVKGKVSLLDIPSGLASRCSVVNLLIGRINHLVQQYSKFATVKKDINNVKYLLAEQLGAVSQILLNLGDELDKQISFDAHLELQIASELLAQNIICSEVVLYDERGNISAQLIIKGDNAYNPNIEKIISKKLKTKMKVVHVSPIDINEYFSVELKKDNTYDIVFGLSSMTKTGSTSSGDTHSLVRLGDEKFLIALCDGMGSGEKANKISALTISLIENFYKAGFSNETIIASVNKLLQTNSMESFSTLDLCLIDLNSETMDFIKVGAPESIVKRDTSFELIDGGSLPMGIVENVTPVVRKTFIDTKSIVVMATDGITDAFGDEDKYADFIKQIASSNPQVISETILNEAIRRSHNLIKDDMTVLVARTFLKNM